MDGGYFDEEMVLEMLGGVQQAYISRRRKYYVLNNGDIVVIRNNSKTADYYWYNIQSDLLRSDINYVVCVAGFEGIYCLPLSLISKCAEENHLSLTKNGKNYKLVLQRFSGEMSLRLIGSATPIAVEQFQVYRDFYEKTNEITPNLATLLSEGAKKEVFVNAYERNPIARRKCIEHYGARCQVCGFDFAETYGSAFAGLIEVHHIVPISSIKTEYVVDPIKDLIPLCSNCHTAIHKMVDGHFSTVEELRRHIG